MSSHTTTRNNKNKNMPAKAFLKWLAPDRVIVKLWKQGSPKPSLNKAFFAMQPPKDLKILDEDGHEIEDMLLCDIRQHQFLRYEGIRYHVKGVDGKHHHKRCLFLQRQQQQQQQRHQHHQSSQTTSRGLGLRELAIQKQTLEQSCQTLTPPRIPTVLFPKEGRAAGTARITSTTKKESSTSPQMAASATASTLRRSARQRKSVGRLITE